MRNRYIICILLLGWFSSILQAQQESTPPILAVMKRADSSIQYVGVIVRVPGPNNTDLALVVGSSRSDRDPDLNGTFSWHASESLSLVSQDRNDSGNIRILKSYRHNSDGCCSLRVLRATPSEIVLSRTGEASDIRPNLKLMIDSNSGAIATLEYLPFSISSISIDSGVPTFLAGDNNQFLSIRATNTGSFLQLLSGRASAPSRPVSVVSSALSGARSPKLPQSTYEEFAAARPRRVTDGYRKGSTKIEEAIGPVQVVGMRAWFGKTFYDGEGKSGVGGFGYLDPGEQRFHLFSPPEIRDWSVSAIFVEDEVAWLGLVGRGESADVAGGLLRVNIPDMQVRKYGVEGIVNDFVRYESRLYVATSRGIDIVLADGSIQHAFIDMAADKSYQLNFTTP